jgi:hypothetical protein
MSVTSGDVYGFDGALMSTARPHEWFEGLFDPEIARHE